MCAHARVWVCYSNRATFPSCRGTIFCVFCGVPGGTVHTKYSMNGSPLALCSTEARGRMVGAGFLLPHPCAQAWHLNQLSSPHPASSYCCRPRPHLAAAFRGKAGQEEAGHVSSGRAPQGVGTQPEIVTSSLGSLQGPVRKRLLLLNGERNQKERRNKKAKKPFFKN